MSIDKNNFLLTKGLFHPRIPLFNLSRSITKPLPIHPQGVVGAFFFVCEA